jgi:hypothetical protein
MRIINPIENTGVVINKANGEIVGSCFLFRYPTTLLTATHCVSDISNANLAIALPPRRTRGHLFDVAQVVRHPTADLAILTVNGIDERDVTSPVGNVKNDAILGLDVLAYGYAMIPNVTGAEGPTPRMFKGYFQRFFHHSSNLGFLAMELSVPCPRGLSGSAVLNAQFIGRLYGVVRENVEVSTEVSSTLNVDDVGHSFKEVYRDILKYGICLWLPSVSDWLDLHVAPVSQEEDSRHHGRPPDDRCPAAGQRPIESYTIFWCLRNRPRGPLLAHPRSHGRRPRRPVTSGNPASRTPPSSIPIRRTTAHHGPRGEAGGKSLPVLQQHRQPRDVHRDSQAAASARRGFPGPTARDAADAGGAMREPGLATGPARQG